MFESDEEDEDEEEVDADGEEVEADGEDTAEGETGQSSLQGLRASSVPRVP